MTPQEAAKIQQARVKQKRLKELEENPVFLQLLEGDRAAVNALYHRLLKDGRHRDTAGLDMSEIPCRRFTGWSMGLIASLESNRQLFLKYSGTADFDPYSMSAVTLRSFFDEG